MSQDTKAVLTAHSAGSGQAPDAARGNYYTDLTARVEALIASVRELLERKADGRRL